jgi:hypothetical protein
MTQYDSKIDQMELDQGGFFSDVIYGRSILGKVLVTLYYIAAIALMVLVFYKHFPSVSSGDEGFYAKKAAAIGQNGLYKEMSEGNPVGYTFPVYILSLLGMQMLTAARFLTVLSTLFVIFSLRFIGQRYFRLQGFFLNLLTVMTLLTILSGTFFVSGISDMWYAGIMIWVLIYIWNTVKVWAGWQRFALSGIFLSATLMVRPLTIIFIVAVMCAIIFIAFFTKVSAAKKITNIVVMLIFIFITVLLQQYPAIHERSMIALENKGNEKYHANWVQLNTLSMMKADKGEKLSNGHHASWQETDDYLKANGEKSLPSGYFERMQWNPGFYLRHLLKTFFDIIYSFFRQIGILFLIPLVFLFKKNDDYRRISWFEILAIVYVGLYAAIDLWSETRHLFIPMLISCLLGLHLLNKLRQSGWKNNQWVLAFQHVMIIMIIALDIMYYKGHLSI